MITVLSLYNDANSFSPKEKPRTLYVLFKGIYQGIESEYHGWMIYSRINRQDLDSSEAEFLLVNPSDEFGLAVIFTVSEWYQLYWEILDIVYPTRDKDKILRRLNTISKWKEEYCGELPL